MAYDSLTTAAVAADLHRRLTGSRIDKIVGPADQAVGLLFWTGTTNQWVLFSAHAVHARVAPTAHRLAGAGAEPTSFVMLLRKYLEGQRVTAFTQAGRDRVLTLEAGTAGVILIAEVMGKHSNIILVDGAGVILGAVKRVTAEVNRYRQVLPHRPYVPPPPPLRPVHVGEQDGVPKLDPLTCMAGDLCAALSGQSPEQPLWQALIDCLDGCSPQLAKEIVARHAGPAGTRLTAGQGADLETGRGLLAIVRGLYGPAGGLWTPSVAWRGEKSLSWAAYPLRQYEGQPDVEIRLSGTLEETFDQVYGGGEAGMEAAEPLDAARQPLLEALDRYRERTRRKITSLQAGLASPEKVDDLRHRGELLLTYSYQIEEGQKVLKLEDPPIEIALDPMLTAVENAQVYFHRYTKARDAARKVPTLIEEAEAELAFLDQARVFVDLARSPSDLAQVRADLRDAGVAAEVAAPVKKAPKTPKWAKSGKGRAAAAAKGGGGPAQAVMRVRSADGTEILVGRSAAQNDLVTFSLATGTDIWLHAREIPGAHVIIKTGGRPPTPGTLRHAAELAATYSQGRSATAVPVDYTFVRQVRRIKGGKPGLVHYSGETTLNVKPRLEDG